MYTPICSHNIRPSETHRVPIIEGIDKLISDIIGDFTKNIENLSNKYGQTLKDIDEEIEKTENELSKMIDELTGSEFDMKGLQDFKSLIILNHL